MKRIHKLLYSLFGFFACNFGAHAATVTGRASTYTLRPYSGLSTSHDFFCCKGASGSTCATEMNTGVCSNNMCYELAQGKYDSVTVSYVSVWGLNLYGCQIDAQGCYSQSRGFNGTKCVDCPTGSLSSCSILENHKNTCGSACDKGYYYKDSQCVRCHAYTTPSGGSLYGTSSYCRSAASATETNCYLPNGTSAKDATGYFSITGGNCFYKS